MTAGRVVVTAPTTPGEYTFTYGIVDAYGASAQGVLLVVVDADSSPKAPIARDDRVPSLAVGEKPTVDIAVLENDEDPDGTVEALTLAVADADATVAGGIVKVTLTDAPRVVRYSITDEDGLSAQAFIFVPGLATLAPSLMSTEPVLVKSGEKITIPLSEHVHVRPGKTPRIATADSLRASHASGESLLADETTLAYTSAAGYFGPDAIGVLVTDGSGPDDPEGVSGYVSIPIRVLPAENQSPTVRSASLSVAPGEEASVLSLAKLATDPDEGDQEKLTFSVEGDVPAGYRAEVKGSTLEVSADASVVPGTTASIKVRASDGTTTPGEGTVTLNAVVSQRPFPVANDDVIPQANQGEKRLVDVLANDFNPFADKGPLTLVSARVDSGRGDAAVVGGKVEVTPAGDFFGSMIVTYRVADATGSPERQVDGRITLTVQGKPAAPTTPTVTSIQDRTVVLSWGAPANNGAAITGYTVTAPQGYSKQCASTTCTLDGLTNDVEYTFTVVATNSVGDSQPSPSSAPARPDARPDTPAAPTLVFGDKSLQVAWATPRSNGSPVLGYTLEVSPAPASGPIQKTGVTGNSLTWEGLQNGVAYQVRVQAQNRAPEPSEWSPYSASVVPAGVPDAPGQPSTTPSSPVGSQAQIAVSWAAPANANGDPVAGYTLSVKQGGAVVNTIETTSTSQNVVVDTSETDYSFSVTARNKAGSSAASADSAARRGAVAPGAPTNVTAEPRDTALHVTYGAASGNGSRASELTYRYRINQTGAEGQVPADGVIGGLSNGTTYSVSIWAVSSVEGVQPGPATSSNEVVPFGKPIITLLSIERLDKAVRFRWNVNPNGRGLSQSSYGGAGDNEFTATGLQPSQSYTHNVSYSNEAGQSAASWTGQANDRPPKNMTISQASGSIDVRLVVSGFEPNRSLSIACWVTPRSDGQGGDSIGTFTVVTDGNGAGDWNWPATCRMTGGGYGNLRLGNEIWSNTIKLN